MIIRASRVDRYVFDGLCYSSRTAMEWMEEAKKRAPWLSRELLADFFLCFFLSEPEIDQTQEATPFHRWMVQTLRKQYFYQTIHPRTIGQESASFKTAIKALMWLAESFAEEVKKREREQQMTPLVAGLKQKQHGEGNEQAKLSEFLTEKQISRLQLVGYTLQQGKRLVEEKQEVLDSRPLVEAEIQSLKGRIEELREDMRVQFTKRSKLQQKVKKLEEELTKREKQHERLTRQEREAIERFEQELGQWLDRSLKETLSGEENDTLFIRELLEASQRFANRRWGNDLGKLRRQALDQYLQWVDKLKRHPDLLSFLEEVGRNVHHFRIKKKEKRTRRMPEEYDNLRQSGDIGHMLPSEAVLLADPDYETYFLLKWLEQKLMTYDTTGWYEEPPKGPVIFMLDTSHSMKGGKLRLAQVFVMTFAALCLLEKRDFMLLLFGAKGELLERALYHKRPDWPGFYALAQTAFGGGTHFDAPMKRAIRILEDNNRFQSADLVMATDGIGGLSAYVRDMLAQLAQKKQVRLHTLIVGSARQHLVQQYDILGVSHRVRFASTWESRGEEQTGLLLDVFSTRQPSQ
ncbi:hypothetical protein [Brevibacillus borstelensis]|uniref:hypothetical protein n=1 Tax=Brevibacillus TaxID=55080 RepID=UPI000F08BB39|nr:hypothetical protein [Brevibacillus borstelensis]MCM3593621.1 hypothetical protein [Brevibacillus borstelensis]MED1884824.1 hypothetical protein [Brevibacillus borstelensis]RNB57492.1 hypothetical protein EDM54_22820 [Brevibacillus borstelensis]WNF08239.1 hypothetical protein RFB14_12920 [Brevibacillus borstelensis]GED55069.1 hypothetical protein BBO01nite_43100 [Brevibacillus borstelensis]